jgi:hypothetical protein
MSDEETLGNYHFKIFELMRDIVHDVNNLPLHESWAVRVRQSLGLRVVEQGGSNAMMGDWYESWYEYLDTPKIELQKQKRLWTCCTMLQNHLQIKEHTTHDMDVFDTIDDVANRQNKALLEPLESKLYRFYRQFSGHGRRISASPAHERTERTRLESLLSQL